MFRWWANARHLILSGHRCERGERHWFERGDEGLCANFARDMGAGCSPGSSGRKWQGGGGHTLRGVAIFADVLGILGIYLLRPGLRARRN